MVGGAGEKEISVCGGKNDVHYVHFTYTKNNVTVRGKTLIYKCLNRITYTTYTKLLNTN